MIRLLNVGKFNISRFSDDSLWISINSEECHGEGMEADEDKFRKWISKKPNNSKLSDWVGKFYYENF